MLRQGLSAVVLGLVVGLAGAAAVNRLLESLLFGVGSRDPATLGAVAAVLLTVGTLACWIPARRATRVDPSDALRAE